VIWLKTLGGLLKNNVPFAKETIWFAGSQQ
jgi:hypothetical protein